MVNVATVARNVTRYQRHIGKQIIWSVILHMFAQYRKRWKVVPLFPRSRNFRRAPLLSLMLDVGAAVVISFGRCLRRRLPKRKCHKKCAC